MVARCEPVSLKRLHNITQTSPAGRFPCARQPAVAAIACQYKL
jgi:hypothetical protein